MILYYCIVSCADIRQGFDSTSVRDKMKSDARQKRDGGEGSSLGVLGTNFSGDSRGGGGARGGSSSVGGPQLEMKGMIAQQDSQLEQLGSAVERLGDMAGSINDELKEQNRMLEQLDEDLDDAGNKMNTVMTTLAKSLRTKDSCELYTVIILILITIFLRKFCYGLFFGIYVYR